MTYDPNVPDVNNSPAVSQPKLLINSGQLDTVFNVDHYKFSDSSGDAGKHRKVTFFRQSQGTIDNLTVGADEVAWYSKASGGQTEIFGKNAAGTEYQVTKDGAIYTGLRPVAAVNFDESNTIYSSFNVASVAKQSGQNYIITFTNPITPDNNYFWTVSGMGSNSPSPLPGTGEVTPAVNYDDSVKTTAIYVSFLRILNLVRGSVICWRVQ